MLGKSQNSVGTQFSVHSTLQYLSFNTSAWQLSESRQSFLVVPNFVWILKFSKNISRTIIFRRKRFFITGSSFFQTSVFFSIMVLRTQLLTQLQAVLLDILIS